TPTSGAWFAMGEAMDREHREGTELPRAPSEPGTAPETPTSEAAGEARMSEPPVEAPPPPSPAVSEPPREIRADDLFTPLVEVPRDEPIGSSSIAVETASTSEAKVADTPSASEAKVADTPSPLDAKVADTPSQSETKVADTPSQSEAKVADTPSPSEAK